MKTYMLLLEMPVDEDLAEMDQEAQFQIALLDTLFPARIALGSQLIDPRKMMFCKVEYDRDNLLPVLEGMILLFELDWQILGLQEAKATVPVYAEEPDEMENPVVDHMEAFKLMDLSPRVYDFIPEMLDEDDNVIPPAPKNITRYQGYTPWVA